MLALAVAATVVLTRHPLLGADRLLRVAPGYSPTIFNAVSSDSTLTVMLEAALIAWRR